MGPRILGRGNIGGQRRRRTEVGFNGAADFGPRKYQKRTGARDGDSASMGPRILGRGNRRLDPSSSDFDGLQWGRGFWAAEIESRQESHHALPRFNGAADFGPRKSRMVPIDGVLPLLQWGRGFWAAEMMSRSHLGTQSASLQWGRGFWAAEIAPRANPYANDSTGARRECKQELDCAARDSHRIFFVTHCCTNTPIVASVPGPPSHHRRTRGRIPTLCHAIAKARTRRPEQSVAEVAAAPKTALSIAPAGSKRPHSDFSNGLPLHRQA